MMDFEGKERYLKHYLDPRNYNRMLQYLFNREGAVIAPSWTHEEGAFQNGQRNYRIHEPYMIKKIHKFKSDNCEYPMNWYYSLAEYKAGLPFKNFMIPKEQKTHWIMNHWKHMISYDFVIDIDAPSFEFKEAAFKDAHRIAVDLALWADKVEIRDSGKGFHVVVLYEDLTPKLHKCSFDPYVADNIYSELKKIALYYYHNFSEMVDTSIYDSRRVVKIPGSLAVYKDKIVPCEVMELIHDE